ncbi:ATP-binding protein [Neobacillus sp. LXY-1]|uniref:ATP-binding protein n=1 Tax=Neobacillus sp. LXY-1 TaxID=3379133 RepID=UPI003EDF16B2
MYLTFKIVEGLFPLDFILLVSISLIPFFCGLIILFAHKMDIARYFSYFLFLLSFWQMDVAILYAGDYLSEKTIEMLFRIFRFGPIMIMPLLYFVAFYIFKTEIADKNGRNYHKWLFTKSHSTFFLLFSLIVYGFNLTHFGVVKIYRIQPYPSFPVHFIPTYGALNLTFLINIILVFVQSFLILFICHQLPDKKLSRFYRSLVFGSLFIYINGILSGYLVFPLFFSVLNSFFAAFILIVTYFILQNAIIKTVNQELEEERNFLEIILNIYPNYLYVKNDQDEFVLVNEKFAQLCNKKPSELIGLKGSEIIERYLSMERKQDSNEVVIFSNGEQLITEWNSLSISFKGNHDHTLCLGTDITMRKKDEEMLVKSENLRVLGEMAAGIAHEIRNPLTSIKGFIKLLDQSILDTNEKYYLTIISDEIDRINEVVGELLFIAKPQATFKNGKVVLINKVIHDVKILIDTTALLLQVSIEIQTKANIETRSIEEKQLKQVLINIVKNSLEAVSKGGKIRVKSERIGQKKFRIRIIDNGDGIPKQILKKLGEPFYTTKERGTGLGLTVCFKIIRENNGDIFIRSKKGLGTIVDLVLPE